MKARAAAVIGASVMTAALNPGQALANGGPPPGVHVDPGSPAGKQYQIPIPAARQETSGSTGSANSDGSNPPLFGGGPPAPPPSGTSTSTPGSGPRTSSSHARTTTAHPKPRVPAAPRGDHKRSRILAASSAAPPPPASSN